MSTVFDVIKNRRSVRFYDEKEIPKEIVEKIIEAGNCAPSGANLQPWRFVVVESREVRKKLADNALSVYKNWIQNADGNLKAMRKEIDELHSDPIYYSAPLVIFVIGSKILSYETDCPMVCQNMMLAGREMGIGSCWVHFGQMGLNEEILKMLEVSENEKVFGPILFGYPKGGFPESPVKKDAVVKWL